MPKKRKIKLIDYKRLYKEVFGSDSGKLVLTDMANRYYVFNPTKRKTDVAGDMDFREGQRNVVLAILSIMNYDLDQLNDTRETYSMEVTNE